MFLYVLCFFAERTLIQDIVCYMVSQSANNRDSKPVIYIEFPVLSVVRYIKGTF